MSKRGRRKRLTAVAAVAVLGDGLAINAWMNRGPETKVYEGPVAGYPLLAGSDGRTLTLGIGWGCEKQPQLVARESAGAVKISLRHTVPRASATLVATDRSPPAWTSLSVPGH